jgi:hypothetical protein
MKTLTHAFALSMIVLSTGAFAQVNKKQIAAYEKQGYNVDVGSITFNAGPSSLEIPGTSVCTDGTFLKAGQIQLCDTPEGLEALGVNCDGATVTFDLQAPIHYMYTSYTPEGGIPDANDGIPQAAVMPSGVNVTVSSESIWSEGGPSADIARTFYSFPSCK